MDCNHDDVELFLGVRTIWCGHDERIATYQYDSARLRYELWIDLDRHAVFISADPEHPFGSDSLYEISVHCDAIGLVPDPYYPGTRALAFWRGSPGVEENTTLVILRRPDGTSRSGLIRMDYAMIQDRMPNHCVERTGGSLDAPLDS
jgi:hypothetical protein